jgi:hypothetical protein
MLVVVAQWQHHQAAITRPGRYAKGLGGANIIDAGGPNGWQQTGAARADFSSPKWRGSFSTLPKPIGRLELGFNIQSGWNLGGPTVVPNAAKLTIGTTDVGRAASNRSCVGRAVMTTIATSRRWPCRCLRAMAQTRRVGGGRQSLLRVPGRVRSDRRQP